MDREQIKKVSENIGMALSVIYSRRLGAEIQITCIPAKVKEEKNA